MDAIARSTSKHSHRGQWPCVQTYLPVFGIRARRDDLDKDIILAVLRDRDVLELSGEVRVVVNKKVLHCGLSQQVGIVDDLREADDCDICLIGVQIVLLGVLQLCQSQGTTSI